MTATPQLKYADMVVKMVITERSAITNVHRTVLHVHLGQNVRVAEITCISNCMDLRVKITVVCSAVVIKVVILMDDVLRDVSQEGGMIVAIGYAVAEAAEHATEMEDAQAVLGNNMVMVDLVDRVTVEEMETASLTVHVSVRQIVLLVTTANVLPVRVHFMEYKAIANASASVEGTTHATIQDFVRPVLQT